MINRVDLTAKNNLDQTTQEQEIFQNNFTRTKLSQNKFTGILQI